MVFDGDGEHAWMCAPCESPIVRGSHCLMSGQLVATWLSVGHCVLALLVATRLSVGHCVLALIDGPSEHQGTRAPVTESGASVSSLTVSCIRLESYRLAAFLTAVRLCGSDPL